MTLLYSLVCLSCNIPAVGFSFATIIHASVDGEATVGHQFIKREFWDSQKYTIFIPRTKTLSDPNARKNNSISNAIRTAFFSVQRNWLVFVALNIWEELHAFYTKITIFIYSYIRRLPVYLYNKIRLKCSIRSIFTNYLINIMNLLKRIINIYRIVQ